MLMAGADGRQSAALTSAPLIVVVPEAPRARPLKDFISEAPKAPGKLNHGSAATVRRAIWRRCCATGGQDR